MLSGWASPALLWDQKCYRAEQALLYYGTGNVIGLGKPCSIMGPENLSLPLHRMTKL